jgi:hypothetical protein
MSLGNIIDESVAQAMGACMSSCLHRNKAFELMFYTLIATLKGLQFYALQFIATEPNSEMIHAS